MIFLCFVTVCKYTTGKYGPCVNGITERVDKLKKKSSDICEPVRTLTKKCRGRNKIKKIKGKKNINLSEEDCKF